MGKKFKSKRKAKLASDSTVMMMNSDIPVMNSSKRKLGKSDVVNLSNVAATAEVLNTNHDNDTEDVPENWSERINDDDDDVEDSLITQFSSSVQVSGKLIKDDDEEYYLYPTDFWHILGDYVRPEDVGVFAAICRSSYRVVSSQGFWRRLYARHYHPHLHYHLPDRLQPECMSRPRGLRAAVIQMLHLTYQPFIERQSRTSSVWPDPHTLTGNICLLQSSSRVGNKATYFYFKLRSASQRVKIEHDEDNVEYEEDDQYLETAATRKLISDLSDINHNPEEGCRLLQISCATWSSLAPVMGQKLLSVSLSVAHGMRYHKLKLMFGSALGGQRRQAGQHETVELVVDSVFGVKILDWWHPHYHYEEHKK